MKSKFHILAALVCAAALTACGGGSSNNNSTPAVVQPAFSTSDNNSAVLPGAVKAEAGKSITVHYTGWLYDASKGDKKGGKFDSSVDRGQPINIVLGTGQVIAGWEQGLPGMLVGSKRTLVIPANLAYGAGAKDAQKDASGNVLKDPSGVPYVGIPANSALLFEIELISVNSVVPPVDVFPPALVKTDLVVGAGAEAVAGKALTVNYTGWVYTSLTSDNKGAKFDSSVGRGPFPFTLGAGEVIKGWDLGVVGMKVGGTRRLVIPADLAYGAAGRPPTIPANASLLFEIELLTVK
ncbi:FKBP-type peptidyl-prolyl cis-trans isomerase [Rugamonas rubra]|uniref:Peptidyl-prolyl cis-trans isomerase n=1 Tax=Rugamonas rubra TaxID=758825 RepID=A0A1I4KD16_9BURK|nr:FKBP-type peptidyl-prolyl cis-trans isomerase [Rugamonas rubra]SFL76685.1 peptidylprolyl isomerase [Rugamonas rubra]